MAAHKHAEIIKQWADGAKVQFLESNGEWRDAINPQWGERMEYRIKPAEPKRVYPVSMVDSGELHERYNEFSARIDTTYFDDLHSLANWVLHRACDDGVVVPRAEFDRAVGDRQKRDMAVARAVDAWYCEMVPNKQRNSDNYLSEIIKSVK